jgi:hypothetical protein
MDEARTTVDRVVNELLYNIRNMIAGPSSSAELMTAEGHSVSCSQPTATDTLSVI